jgi:hypothetical protein
MDKIKQYVVEIKAPDNANDNMIKEYLKTAISLECGCRNPEEDPMYHLDRESVKILNFVKRGRMVCIPTFSQWFDENRSRLLDTSAIDAAMLMYNDIFKILINECDKQ